MVILATKMSTERNLSSLLLPPTFPERQRSTEEIANPSNFDVPDSFLISIFTFSFKKVFQKKKFRVIGNGIGTFIAIVLYQHAVYDLLWFYSNQTIYIIYSISLLFGSILLLVLSRSLESIVQYDAMDNEQNFALSIINDTPYLCGFIDRDLVTCCGVDCTLHIKGYHIYILRIIRYNINAILISACWVGSDSSFGILTERVMNRRDAPRLGLDIFLLILSNLLLLYCGQLSGQMGVFSDEHAVESISISETATILEKSVTQIDQNANIIISERGPVTSAATPVIPAYTPPSMTPLSTSQPNTQGGGGGGGGDRQEDLSFDERFTERESSLIERSKMEMSLHFKVTLTLVGVLIYWFSLWDLCWNYPREALIQSAYESRDDDVEPVDSYSRRHVSPQIEIYLLLIGILYCIASSLVLILTGGLYSMVNNDTEETHAVHRHTITRFEKALRRWGIDWSRLDSLSIQIGDKLFMPIRLIEYNILGAFGVIAWIGFDTILTSLENLFVFNFILSPVMRYSLDVFEILVAMALLTWLEQFGNQFGGRENLSKKHEIVSLDNAFHPAADLILEDRP